MSISKESFLVLDETEVFDVFADFFPENLGYNLEFKTAAVFELNHYFVGFVCIDVFMDSFYFTQREGGEVL